MWSRTYSVLAFRLMVTLWFCPHLIDGLDRTISPEDLKRGLERFTDNSPFHGHNPMEVIEALDCIQNTCEKFNKQLRIREVLIRNQFKTIGESCNTPNDEKLILEPPKAPGDELFYGLGDPEKSEYYKKYFDWQEKVLDSGKNFCDPNKNLFCSTEKKCSCKAGSKWKIGALQRLTLPYSIFDDPTPTFKLDTCIIPPGGACKIPDTKKDDDSPRYLDPINRLSVPPPSVPALSCEFLEYNKQDGCSSIHADYFMGPICLNEELDKKLPIFKKNINENSKVLGVGDICDFEAHTLLYKSEALDFQKFNVRLKALEARKASGVSLCDLRKFLTCGKSGKCECLEQTVLEGVECTLPVSERKCGDNPAVKAMIMKNSFVPDAQRQLAQGIEKLSMDGCGPKSICYTDLQNSDSNDVEMFCICKGFFTGENCDQVLTLFLPFTRPSSLPSDVKDTTEKLKIFTEFNREAVKFQEKLKLKSGEQCDFYKELEIRRLIRRIDSLTERSTTMTKADYQSLINATSNFTQNAEQYCLRNFDPEREFLSEHSPYNQPIECRYDSLVCQTPLPVADRSQGQILSSHRRILETYFSTLECGNNNCTKNIDYESGEIRVVGPRNEVDRLENYLHNKTKFCVRPRNAGIKLICETGENGVTRKCVCRGADPSCTRICSNVTSLGLTMPNRGESLREIRSSRSGGVLLLFVFLDLLI